MVIVYLTVSYMFQITTTVYLVVIVKVCEGFCMVRRYMLRWISHATTMQMQAVTKQLKYVPHYVTYRPELRFLGS